MNKLSNEEKFKLLEDQIGDFEMSEIREMFADYNYDFTYVESIYPLHIHLKAKAQEIRDKVKLLKKAVDYLDFIHCKKP